jgi:hypothetical protein
MTTIIPASPKNSFGYSALGPGADEARAVAARIKDRLRNTEGLRRRGQ